LVKSMIRRNTEQNICATQLALAARTNTTLSLSRINVPVLIIRGEEDQLVSLEQVKRMEEMIPNVRYVELAGCAHLPNLENPVRFNEEVRDFLMRMVLH